jgi:hypothetical protein
VEGPCGDSARCEASAGINGVVCGADIFPLHRARLPECSNSAKPFDRI